MSEGLLGWKKSQITIKYSTQRYAELRKLVPSNLAFQTRHFIIIKTESNTYNALSRG